MSKAEERALEAYPNVEQPVWDESYPKTLFVRHTERNAFIKGYEQAEKDIGWISVKDRLPEVCHFVLTCVSDTVTPQCVGMALLLEDGTWWDGYMKVRVDYWMEVPRLKEGK